MNAQQKAAIALFIELAVAGPKRRAELMKKQHSFIVVSHGEERVVAHGEFFAAGHPPLRGVVQTMAGLVVEDVEGGVAFVPLYPSASFAPSAPVAPAAAPVVSAPAPAPVAAPAPARLLVTRSRRVTFGEEVTCHNGTFTSTLVVIAPSSGAIIEERFSDGQVIVTFVGASRQTWTII